MAHKNTKTQKLDHLGPCVSADLRGLLRGDFDLLQRRRILRRISRERAGGKQGEGQSGEQRMQRFDARESSIRSSWWRAIWQSSRRYKR